MRNMIFSERLKREREKKAGHKQSSLKRFMLVASPFPNGRQEKTIQVSR